MIRTVLFVVIFAAAVASWVAAVVFQFKAAAAADHRVPWSSRINGLRVLFGAEGQTEASRGYWRRHLISVALFLGSVGAGAVVDWLLKGRHQ